MDVEERRAQMGSENSERIERALATVVPFVVVQRGRITYINEAGGKRLKEIIRLSPRTFGYETSLWSRELLAQQLHQEGHSRHQVCPSTITVALRRVGISWRRAKKWIRSPDPAYQRRKKDEIG